MKSLREKSVGEVAAYVAGHLRQSDINVVLNGGSLEFATGSLRLLSATDCVKDRLDNFYHWKDRQCLDQAIMVATDAEVDIEEVERWSRHEGMTEEFERIKELLKLAT